MVGETHISVIVRPTNAYAVEYICNNLREIDKIELFASLPSDNPLILTTETYGAMKRGHGVVIWVDGLPAALCGLAPDYRNPNMYQVFAFGTDAWKQAVYYVSREASRMAREELDANENAMRLQADSHEKHTCAHKWLEVLGATRESEMPHYGRDGATFYRYVWIRGGEWMNRFKRWESYREAA
ncbi:MAG: hypothetical protein GY938_11325 [Ketobacter sp.]|nr:hypothetical protein [Ketobacter sp.]